MNASVDESADRTVRLVRVYETSAQHLFDCFTDPALVAGWWGPAGTTCPHAENDLQVGGRYRFEMLGTESGQRFVSHGEYLEIDPPRRLAFTWAWEHEPDEVTRVTLTFRSLDAQRTELELVHDQFPTAQSAVSHNEGWSTSLECLAVVAEQD